MSDDIAVLESAWFKKEFYPGLWVGNSQAVCQVPFQVGLASK